MVAYVDPKTVPVRVEEFVGVEKARNAREGLAGEQLEEWCQVFRTNVLRGKDSVSELVGVGEVGE